MSVIRKISAAAIVLAAAASAQAVQLVSFDPFPLTPTLPEVVFGGAPVSSLKDADGFHGSALAGPGGLNFQSSLPIVGVLGGTPLASGGTGFVDVTLTLGGLGATAPASSFTNIVIQGLDQGRFSFVSSAPSGKVDLLSGTIGSAQIVGVTGSNTGSLLSSTITYTSGKVFDALVAAGLPTTGQLSWTLLSVAPGFAIGPNNVVAPFGADVNGQFTVPFIPEPTTTSIFAIAAAGLAGRRRKA